MSKVFHLTLMLEVEDEVGSPEDWDWSGPMLSFPGIRGFTIVETQQRPFSCMESDPICYTHH